METTQELTVCRTCLKKTDSINCKKLTPETLYDGKLVLKMLNFCIPEMLINLACGYPAICTKCLEKLGSLYKFKDMCLKNDSKYRKKYLKKADLNGYPTSVPSFDSDINISSTSLNSTGNDNRQGSPTTDVNQNHTSTTNQAGPALNEEKLIKKTFSPYRKRFTNVSCFGCHNHIRDVKYHTGDLCCKEYVCFNCDKNFPTIAAIRKHMHSHLYPYKCKLCGKKWRDAHQMSLHLRSHTKQRPFECPECGKKFAQSYNLHQHLATHKGDKNNENRCAECGKVLSTKYNLKIHLTTHNIGFKPRCSRCNKWFYTKAALDKHLGTCVVVKEEIYIDEPEFIKSEPVDYVKREVLDYVNGETSETVKKESESDDDVFLEETSC